MYSLSVPCSLFPVPSPKYKIYFARLLSKHSAVISKFGELFARTSKIDPKFHRYLIDAEQIRLKGDYDRSERLTAEDAKLLIERAEEFLELINYL
ncbi:HEPN domain-containing protein [Cuspidothrix issatschenkoi]|uniref:HEPN domain-containing protein n=1 Tax=Cuspidothrix issatschenkoi TaxID=230752 RepID=UPI002AD2EE35|nr:HEPN domain-containing protein [Cuspidothrix issatschenkoi]